MSYLLRVVLPDRPGMLGAVATALGEAGGDIVSLDVVERGPGRRRRRPRRGDAAGRARRPAHHRAQSRAGRGRRVAAALLRRQRPAPRPRARRRARRRPRRDGLAAAGRRRARASSGPAGRCCSSRGRAGRGARRQRRRARTSTGSTCRGCRWTSARRLRPASRGCPERWEVLGTELAAAPVGRPDRAVLLGRGRRAPLPRLGGAAPDPPGGHRRDGRATAEHLRRARSARPPVAGSPRACSQGVRTSAAGRARDTYQPCATSQPSSRSALPGGRGPRRPRRRRACPRPAARSTTLRTIGPVARVAAIRCTNERSILSSCTGRPAQVPQARVAGAEVVERQRDAELVEPAQRVAPRGRGRRTASPR